MFKFEADHIAQGYHKLVMQGDHSFFCMCCLALCSCLEGVVILRVLETKRLGYIGNHVGTTCLELSLRESSPFRRHRCRCQEVPDLWQLTYGGEVASNKRHRVGIASHCSGCALHRPFCFVAAVSLGWSSCRECTVLIAPNAAMDASGVAHIGLDLSSAAALWGGFAFVRFGDRMYHLASRALQAHGCGDRSSARAGVCRGGGGSGSGLGGLGCW